MKRPKKEWKLIGRGFAGWHAEGLTKDGNKVSSSGGWLNPYKYWTGVDCFGYRQEAFDGCPVYDARPIEGNEELEVLFIHEVYSGPMVDASREKDEEPMNALSFCTVATKIERLRKIPGIKFGVVKKGEVIWEDSSYEPEYA